MGEKHNGTEYPMLQNVQILILRKSYEYVLDNEKNTSEEDFAVGRLYDDNRVYAGDDTGSFSWDKDEFAEFVKEWWYLKK